MPLKIALTVDPELPVPPSTYGGIERIIDMLGRELQRRGHHVTLFANASSTCPVKLEPWPGKKSQSVADTLQNSAKLARAVMEGRFDLIHSSSRIAYLAPLLPLPIPKLMTYHRAISPRTTRFAQRLALDSMEFTAVGRWMIESAALEGRWHSVPNCVPTTFYQWTDRVSDDAPLTFLGRLERIKGPDLAIEVAKKAKRSLVIAGNIEDEHRAWGEAKVIPHIDGERIRYVGPVDDAQKNELLRRSAALLMPIVWDEPFGMVMAEAMACGTPVIGLRRGAVPEVIDQGTTGFAVGTVEEMIDAVGRLNDVSRKACRERAERLYSVEAVTDAYIAIYQSMLARNSPTAARRVYAKS